MRKYCLKKYHFIRFQLKNHTLNVLIFIELLHELPFYNELSIVKRLKTFRENAKIYSTEIIDSKDPSIQVLKICLMIY